MEISTSNRKSFNNIRTNIFCHVLFNAFFPTPCSSIIANESVNEVEANVYSKGKLVKHSVEFPRNRMSHNCHVSHLITRVTHNIIHKFHLLCSVLFFWVTRYLIIDNC